MCCENRCATLSVEVAAQFVSSMNSAIGAVAACTALQARDPARPPGGEDGAPVSRALR